MAYALLLGLRDSLSPSLSAEKILSSKIKAHETTLFVLHNEFRISTIPIVTNVGEESTDRLTLIEDDGKSTDGPIVVDEEEHSIEEPTEIDDDKDNSGLPIVIRDKRSVNIHDLDWRRRIYR